MSKVATPRMANNPNPAAGPMSAKVLSAKKGIEIEQPERCAHEDDGVGAIRFEQALAEEHHHRTCCGHCKQTQLRREHAAVVSQFQQKTHAEEGSPTDFGDDVAFEQAVDEAGPLGTGGASTAAIRSCRGDG